MKDRIFDAIATWSVRRPYFVLGMVASVTVVALFFASHLSIKMQFKNMMPQSDPTVQEFDRIIDQYSSASNIIIAVKGEEKSIKAFADDFAPRLREMSEYIKRVDYKMDRDFVARHGFMMMKAKDLKNTQNLFADLRLEPFLAHLNDTFEVTWIADEESISNSEKEDNAVRSLDGLEYWIRTMDRYVSQGAGPGSASDQKIRSQAGSTSSVDGQTAVATETTTISETGESTSFTDYSAVAAADRMLIGDPYFISPDKQMLLLFAQPTFTLNDIDVVVSSVNAIDSLLAETSIRFPGVDAGTTGMIALGRDETLAATADMFNTTIVAFILIIALFILSFRMWTAPLLAGVSLIIGVVWAAGFAAVTVGSLNMLTSLFAVILVGLGIDYNIHVISGYTELRALKVPIDEAMSRALRNTGNGIVIGSVTTALAFLTMLTSENLGMKEFGIVAGSGVLFCMISSLVTLPSLLVIRDRWFERRRRTGRESRSIAYHGIGRLANGLAASPGRVLFGLLLITSGLLYSALNITFDYNYLNMEPKGLKTVALQHEVIDAFDLTTDMVLVTTSSVESSRETAEKARELGSVGMVTAISDFVPSDSERTARLPYIQLIRDNLAGSDRWSEWSPRSVAGLIDQLNRVEDNVIELAQLAYTGGQDKVDRKARRIVGDLDLPTADRLSLIAGLVRRIESDPGRARLRLARFEREVEPAIRRIAGDMTDQNRITVADLPESIRDQFVSKDGSQYLVSIFPRQQVWDMEFLGRFTEQMHRIDPRVTGMPPIFYVLVQYIARDGKTAAALALIVIFLLLWIDFRSLAMSLFAIVTLAVGAVWMVGVMHLFGMQFNTVNVIGVPLILGIGIDDAVHIISRYRREGPGRFEETFSSTGKAVILTTLTTMLAFGSLGFASYRGLASLGLMLAVGVGTALAATLLLIPPLLRLTERRIGDSHLGQQPRNHIGTGLKSFAILALLYGISPFSSNAQEALPPVLEIVRKIDANEVTASSRSVGRQIITTSSGKKRILELESYSVGQNDKMLTVYTGPARVRGDKILMLNDGDDIWFYTPKTDRVRHLASHARRQKVQGSDFSYEDMVSGNFEEDYTHRLTGIEKIEGVPCFRIEAVPTESGPSYSKLIVWADTSRYVTRRIDYYEKEALLKRLNMEDIREVEGHWIPFRMVMTNLRDGGETVFEFETVELNLVLDDRLFTTNNLKKR